MVKVQISSDVLSTKMRLKKDIYDIYKYQCKPSLPNFIEPLDYLQIDFP